MSSYNYFLLDTFSGEEFKGNPTPVCILQDSMQEQQMLLLAREFNAPVSVFVLDKNDITFEIRYFTVTGEIPSWFLNARDCMSFLFFEDILRAPGLINWVKCLTSQYCGFTV